MSGHNKWSKIKRKKGVSDAKKGKLFAKIIREISLAAQSGGADPDANPRLRTVLDKAKSANMPSDNVQRAIKKGTGGLEGLRLEEFILEGYGPGGTAVLVEALTDNRNRTIAEVRHLFTKMGGNLGEAGCVHWMFAKRGVLSFRKSVGEEKLMEVSLEAGAQDLQETEEGFDVTTGPADFERVKAACEKAGLAPAEGSLQMIPSNTLRLEGENAEKMIKLMESLEDHEDVQNVYANFDIEDRLLEKMA